MADKKAIGKYKSELNRNRSDLLTAKGARQNALTQMGAPNLSTEERAKFRDLYQKYDAKVRKLEAERKKIEGNLKSAEANVPEYDTEAGQREAEKLKNQYSLLNESYQAETDKNSSNAKQLKSQMDQIVKDYQAAYSESKGTPVSKSVAIANLTGTDLSKIGATGTVDEPVTLQATKTAETESKATSSGTKTSGKLPDKTWGAGSNIVPDKPSSTIDVTKIPTSGPANVSEDVIALMPAGSTKPTGPGGPKLGSKFEDLIGRTEFWYNLPDYIFKVNPALQNILVKAVDEGWDEAKFLAAAQQTPWWQQNAAAIRTRIVDKAKYDELRSQGLDVSKTDYGLDSATIRRKIQNLAQTKGANLSPEQLDQIVAQAYSGFLENDTIALTQLIAPYIGKIPAIVGKGLPGAGGMSSTYSGEALKSYQALQDIARQNGFKLSDILPRISTATTNGNLEDAVLQKLSTGELDVNAIAQNARMLAAAGQPQYVRDLLNQGYDLSAVYAPYRTAMAGVLELNPDQIDLNDPTLRAGITDKGDMNLYDYRKLLKQDNRWQYTANAAKEVSDSALRVLRDFGMMG